MRQMRHKWPGFRIPRRTTFIVPLDESLALWTLDDGTPTDLLPALRMETERNEQLGMRTATRRLRHDLEHV
jgi:hypothetical protein